MAELIVRAPSECIEWVEALAVEHEEWKRPLSWIERENIEEYNKLPYRRRLLEASLEEQRMWVLAMLDWVRESDRSYTDTYHIRSVLSEKAKKDLPFTHDQFVTVIHKWPHAAHTLKGMREIVQMAKHYLRRNEFTPAVQDAIRARIKQADGCDHADIQRQIAKLEKVAGLNTSRLPLLPGEAWSDHAIEVINNAEPEVCTHWKQILELCARARSAKPSKKWGKDGEKLLDEIGFDAFRNQVMEWFSLVNKPRTAPSGNARGNLYINPINADILRGLAWLCVSYKDKGIAAALADLAIAVFKKEPGYGPRSVSVGNASIWALSMTPGLVGIAQLARLKVKIKASKAIKGIEEALIAVSEREGIPLDDIEELTVPDYGMQEVGVRLGQFGDFTARLAITGTTATTLTWIKPDGKVQKSVPKPVKDQFKPELKEFKKEASDLKKMLPAQRDRIENLFMEQKSWDYSSWRARYLDHPLVGTLARRLIWVFATESDSYSGIWHEGELVDAKNNSLVGIEDATVALWHPIDTDTPSIVSWRNWLVAHRVQQPFKQAYREVYILTDAERNTNVYSNRFAAHIIRQHQFNALCEVRGWNNKLRLIFDGYYLPPTKYLPLWNIRAEFWVEGVGDEYAVDTNDQGTFNYLATDQVRFYSFEPEENAAHAEGGGYGAGGGRVAPEEPVPLEEIPPLVFSEIMRDVDMFIGVTSIGNDPAWIDGGREVPHRNYWQSYAFGDLSATAQTRHTILAQLLPALTIADRCELVGKFLVVRGDVRSYKIHLGSGNILMTPNDQYLCIVPAQRSGKKADKVFLPFEGDRILALILSKAFMLSDDTSIQDKTILTQIHK